MEDAGLLDVDHRYNGMWAARATDIGRSRWLALKASREDIPARRRQMRNDYLAWIYLACETGAPPTATDFIASEFRYLGVPYPAADLDRVGPWLVENGFIRGAGSWQSAGPGRPTITAKGTRYVEDGLDVHEPPPSVTGAGIGVQYNFHGNNTNVAQNSQRVQQTINVGWRSDANELVDAIEAALGRIVDTDARDELQSAAADLRAAASTSDAPVSRTRRIATRIASTLATSAATSAGAELVQHASRFLLSLPA
jgi:hypothetical protein